MKAETLLHTIVIFLGSMLLLLVFFTLKEVEVEITNLGKNDLEQTRSIANLNLEITRLSIVLEKVKTENKELRDLRDKAKVAKEAITVKPFVEINGDILNYTDDDLLRLCREQERCKDFYGMGR